MTFCILLTTKKLSWIPTKMAESPLIIEVKQHTIEWKFSQGEKQEWNLKIPRIEWKSKYNITKSMEYNSDTPKRSL